MKGRLRHFLIHTPAIRASTRGQAQAAAAGRVQERFCWRALGRVLMSLSRQRSGCNLHILVGVACSPPGAHEFVLTAQ